MIDLPADFHFLRPAWLAALLLLPLAWWLAGRRGRKGGPWESIVAPALRPYVLEGSERSGRSGLAGRIALLIGVTLAVLALAGPAWRKLPQPVFRPQSALVIALDLSRSMDARDIAPSRLARAKLELLDLLERRSEGQTALIVYAAQAFVVTPLTNDAATIAALVESLGTDLMPSQGSRADRALLLARDLLKQAGVEKGDVLLITDELDWRDGELTTKLHLEGLRVSVLGVGTAEGAPIPLAGGGLLEDTRGDIVMARLDESALREVAARGGGSYSALRVDDADLDAVLPGAAGSLLDADESTSLSTDLWEEEGPWLLLPLCLLAALGFRRGCLAVVLLALLPFPAGALDTGAWWRRDDQRGVAALESGDAARAAELFEDPEWKASALYRAGRYAESAKLLEGLDDERAHYNRGNALARAGQIPQAIEAYERALELDPQDADAKHNLELLRKLQPPDQQRQQGGNGEQQQSSQGGSRGANDAAQGQARQRQDESAGDDSRPQNEDSSQSGEEESGDQAQAQQRPGEQPPSDARETEDAQARGADRTGDDSQSRTAALSDETQDAAEAARAEEQWLRRIPDDPGGLLRRKFLYQSRQQQRQLEPEERQPW
jgi:Ca-activated chloride channel family protein